MATAAPSVGRITKLPEEVINKIAAGEIVQRPSSALKELLENSLDAHAASVTVIVKGGGLQLLQIQDTGDGIAKTDFPLVCERFATSKLARFEDLASISSYGFRGEALASISFAANVTITSMQSGSPCAYSATFASGRMQGEPRACAGVKGTTIKVENMFATMPERRATVKNAGEEYASCLHVVQKYAIHCAHRGVAFVCKKQGDVSPDLHVAGGTSVADTIGIVYGQPVRRELLQFALEVGGDASTTPAAARRGPRVSFRVDACITNANYNSKRVAFVLFINERLVDNDAIRRAIDAVYADLLPKHTHPFVYVSIRLPQEQLDVNVHPTKREVAFLFQDELIEALVAKVQTVLADANSSRRFATQTVLAAVPNSAPGPVDIAASASTKGDSATVSELDERVMDAAHAAVAASAAPADTTEAAPAGHSKTRSAAASVRAASQGGRDDADDVAATPAIAKRSKGSTQVYRTVRTEANVQTLDAFMQRGKVDADDAAEDVGAIAEPRPTYSQLTATPAAGHDAADAIPVDVDDVPAHEENPQQLMSVQLLLERVRAEAHDGLRDILQKHVFVGLVTRHLSMVQFNTRLLLVNHTQLAREFFYQQVFRSFGRAAALPLSAPLDLQRVCEWALRAQRGVPADQPANATLRDDELDVTAICVAECVEQSVAAVSLLLSKAEMLWEYFSIGIRSGDAVSGDMTTASGRKRPRAATGTSSVASTTTGGMQRVKLTHVPILLEEYQPLQAALPHFLLALVRDVDWESEMTCFHTIAQAIAVLYATPPLFPGDNRGAPTTEQPRTSTTETSPVASSALQSVVAQRWMPAMRNGLLPPAKLAAHHHVVQVASTEQLYRIFERC